MEMRVTQNDYQQWINNPEVLNAFPTSVVICDADGIICQANREFYQLFGYQEEMFLEYQPKIDLVSQNLVGAEVLVRWDSPKFGLVMPGEFITIVERSSLIEDQAYLTLEMTLTQLEKWRDHPTIRSLAINLTVRMLGDRVLELG